MYLRTFLLACFLPKAIVLVVVFSPALSNSPSLTNTTESLGAIAELSATKSFALDNRSLFEAGDAQDLANKIDYWLNHPQDREIMGKRYANEAKKYSLERSVESFVDMCEDMLCLQSGMAMGYEISPQLLAVMRK